MSKNQFRGTATQPQCNRICFQFNNDQYCMTTANSETLIRRLLREPSDLRLPFLHMPLLLDTGHKWANVYNITLSPMITLVEHFNTTL